MCIFAQLFQAKKVHNMKKGICLLAATLLTAGQATGLAAVQSSNPGKTDSLSVSALFELDNSANQNIGGKFKVSSDNLGIGGHVYLGKELTPVWGWRTGAGIYTNKTVRTPQDMEPDRISFPNAEITADMTLDLTDLIAPERKWQGFNLKTFLGTGAYLCWGREDHVEDTNLPLEYKNGINTYFNGENLHLGTRYGIIARQSIGQRLGISMEVSNTMLSDKFSGWRNPGCRYDFRPAVGIGVEYALVQKEPYKEILPVVPVPAPAPKAIGPDQIVMAYLEPQPEPDKQRSLELIARIIYPVDTIILFPERYDNQSELDRVMDGIDKVTLDPTVSVKEILLHGYASPEYTFERNTFLADGRVKAVYRYVLDHGKNIDLNLISYTSTPENWIGVREYYESTDNVHREQIFALIEKDMNDDDRELELKKIIGMDEYNELLKNIYPYLRCTKVRINYAVRNYTLEEARQLIGEKPQNLSLAEMFAVAGSYPRGSVSRAAAIETAYRQYPDNQSAILNMANLMVENGQYDKALQLLEKAAPSPQATHAKGAISVLKGDLENGRKLLEQAKAQGVSESARVLEIINK